MMLDERAATLDEGRRETAASTLSSPGPDPGAAVDLAIFLRNLAGGGTERMMLALAGGIAARGLTVELVLCQRTGDRRDEIPPGVRVHELARHAPWLGRLRALQADPRHLPQLLAPVLLAPTPPATLPYLDALAAYLRSTRPRAFLAAMPFENLDALRARKLAGVPTRVVLSERSTLSMNTLRGKLWCQRFAAPLIRTQYGAADAIAAVSDGVARDLCTITGLPRSRVRTVYNPTVGSELAVQAAAPLDHPWLQGSGPPTILAAGRLTQAKDYPTLIRAFAQLRERQPARLLIVGGAKDAAATERGQAKLMRLADRHGVTGDVALLGHVTNPFAFMARADLFVLSSRWEGFPNVLVEAMACGCPVVATDCPSGPAEILDGGRYGTLVPPGDVSALADAMAATLRAPLPRTVLQARGQQFSVDRAVDAYLDLLLPERPR